MARHSTGSQAGSSGSPVASSTHSHTVYNQTVEYNGTPLTQRTNVNFSGSGVSITDSGGKTQVSITGGAGALAEYHVPLILLASAVSI